MTIIERERVRAAVDRALQLDPQRDTAAAVHAAAQALGLDVELVQQAIEPMPEESRAC